MRKLALGVAIVVVAAAAVVFVMRRGGDDNGEKYRTEALDRGNVVLAVTATGTISAVTTVQVGSQVSGIISRLHADFNSPVRRGQLLAELDPTPFEARVEQRQADVLQAEVQMRRSRLDFERQERLLQEQLASQAEYDAAKAAYDASRAQVDQASAALRQAETDLEYTRILSPIDGVVVDRKYDVGQTVAASFQAPTLFTIAQDLTKMQVLADVDQSDIGRVRVGQTARFTVDAYPEEEFQGTIAQIRLNATVSQNVITYPVILMVENAEEKLRPLMTANVSIEVAQVKDVLRAPNAALRFRPTDAERGTGSDRRQGGAAPGASEGAPRRGGGGFTAAAGALERAVARPEGGGRPQLVYVLDPAGNPKRVPVRTGISDGRFTQIVDGEIGPGDRVIVGQATARVDGAARPPGMGGGGRFF